MSFQVLGLDAKILRAVTEAGYTEPTPIQSAAIPPIIAGHDLIGIAQTGTGKTAAFTLPILTKLAAQPGQRRGTKVLVIAPTRELVVQIEENVRSLREASAVDGGDGVWRRGRTAANPGLARGHGHHHRLPGPVAGFGGPALRGFFAIEISGAGRGRPDAGHGFSAGHPAHRAATAASNGRH